MLRIRCDDEGTVEEHLLRLGLARLMPSPILLRIPFVPLESRDASEDYGFFRHQLQYTIIIYVRQRYAVMSAERYRPERAPACPSTPIRPENERPTLAQSYR